MEKLRQMVLLMAATAILGVTAMAPAQAQVGKTITAPGQTLTNSEGTWSLTTDGQTTSGYAVRLNGKGVGYAVSLTVDKLGYPVATHKDGSVYQWTGSTFKLLKK